MQQWWFDDGLGLKSVIYDVFFYDFSLIFKFFINIHYYANKIICISGHVMKGLCLTFNMVQSSAVYDK